MSIQVLDISNWQPTVDWKMVKTAVAGVFLRASEATTLVDPTFVSHVEGAKSEGLPAGAYHFGHPTSDPIAEADHFLKVIDPYLKDLELMPVLDLEIPTSLGTLTPTQVTDWAVQFMDKVRTSSGRKPMIYTYSYFITMYGLEAVSKEYPLWIASYSDIAPKALGGWSGYVNWQYTDKGTVPGISGHVDLSHAENLDALKGSTEKGTTKNGEGPNTNPPEKYHPVKVEILGKPYLDGIDVQGHTYVCWGALERFHTPFVYKGKGVFHVLGRDVQGVVYRGTTYLPWNDLKSGIRAHNIRGGHNFV